MNTPRPDPEQYKTVRNIVDVIFIMVILALLFLPGCASRPDLQPVNVAIPLACQEKEPEKPNYPWQTLKTTGCKVETCVDEAVRAMAAEIERRDGYETLAITALRACIKPITEIGFPDVR